MKGPISNGNVGVGYERECVRVRVDGQGSTLHDLSR